MALLACVSPSLGAADAIVAVASSFRPTVEALEPLFTARTGFDLVVVSGSTGQLYAQIEHGAPYDVFLAADRERPERAVRSGFAIAESLTDYARGRLALYSRDERAARGAEAFETLPSTLVIANPDTAPYGAAARDVLKHLGVWQSLDGRIAYSQNVAGAYAAVRSGAVELGFVALALIAGADPDASRARYWPVPPEFHAPLVHSGVLLVRAEQNPAAAAFLAWLGSAEATALLRHAGYEPGAP